MKLPTAEAVCPHGGGDLATVAAWLLDRLDRRPPPIGGRLYFYISYHPQDACFFSRAEVDKELARAMLAAYHRELAWDGLGFGELSFDLSEDSNGAHMTLSRRGGDDASPDECRQDLLFKRSRRLFRTHSKAEPSAVTQIELRWLPLTLHTSPGKLGLVRRWIDPLPGDAALGASVTILSGGEISRHVDYWQGNVRWFSPVLYLAAGQTLVTVGANPGCDILAPTLRTTHVVTYDTRSDVWTFGEPYRTASLRQANDSASAITIQFHDARRQPVVSLLGMRLLDALTLEEQYEQNRLDSFALEIVGCLLPRPRESVRDGYGIVPDDFPAGREGSVSSAIALPGNNGWIYVDKETGYPRFLDVRSGRAKELKPGDRLDFTMSTNRLVGVWEESDDALRGYFVGEVRLAAGPRADLVCGDISEDVPNAFFSNYKDGAHGRPPVKLTSIDGRTYSLEFNPGANHPVFLLHARGMGLADVCWPDVQTKIALGSDAEFVIGTTHYRLRKLIDRPTRG